MSKLADVFKNHKVFIPSSSPMIPILKPPSKTWSHLPKVAPTLWS